MGGLVYPLVHLFARIGLYGTDQRNHMTYLSWWHAALDTAQKRFIVQALAAGFQPRISLGRSRGGAELPSGFPPYES
jgi:hypothetical protein